MTLVHTPAPAAATEATTEELVIDIAIEKLVRVGTAMIRGILNLDEGSEEWRLAMYVFIDSQTPPMGIHFVQWCERQIAAHGQIIVPTPHYTHEVADGAVFSCRCYPR